MGTTKLLMTENQKAMCFKVTWELSSFANKGYQILIPGSIKNPA